MEHAGRQEFDPNVERKGLGTPATRAGIIEKLVHAGYVERKGKQLIPTADGMTLIEVVPDFLKSPSMTSEWENQLLEIERGKTAGIQFMQGIIGLVKMTLHGCDLLTEEELQRFQEDKEVIGKCPVCGSDVYENSRNFYCRKRECSFVLWKENRFLETMKKKITQKMACDLLKTGRTHAKDFYSARKKANFEADLVMEIQDGRASFKLEFPDNRKDHKKK